MLSISVQIIMEDRGTFRSGPTRADMLKIKREIEDIKKKSQLGMQVETKDRKRKEKDLFIGYDKSIECRI